VQTLAMHFAGYLQGDELVAVSQAAPSALGAAQSPPVLQPLDAVQKPTLPPMPVEQTPPTGTAVSAAQRMVVESQESPVSRLQMPKSCGSHAASRGNGSAQVRLMQTRRGSHGTVWQEAPRGDGATQVPGLTQPRPTSQSSLLVHVPPDGLSAVQIPHTCE